MTAREAAFTHLIDYAGLYPPAALNMEAAVRNYLRYRAEKHACMLGRFIVDCSRLEELRENAGDELSNMPLSVIAKVDIDPAVIAQALADGFRIECIEMKSDEPLNIARARERIPESLQCFFEIPLRPGCTGAIDAIAAVDARAKLRMGGVVPDAFPPPQHVVEKLQLLTDRRVSFKATAGLHHPLRSQDKLTYSPDSVSGTMHGFLNLLCAAALIRFGGDMTEARTVLEEQNPDAFRLTPAAVCARRHEWNVEQIRELRKFFVSFGSCSFTEPLHDLEALGWL